MIQRTTNINNDIIDSSKESACDCILRKAGLEDAENIYAIMRRVTDALTDKSLFVCDDLDYVRTQLKTGGFGVVACNKDNEIVASFIIRYPHRSEDNLGRDIHFTEEQLDFVAHMESVVVLPKYRGRHLQEKMLRYAEELIDTNRYHYLLATVSPDNPASYLSFERNGYSHIITKEKYGGLQRRIYLKEIR